MARDTNNVFLRENGQRTQQWTQIAKSTSGFGVPHPAFHPTNAWRHVALLCDHFNGRSFSLDQLEKLTIE